MSGARTTDRARSIRAAGLYAAAVVVCLWVLIANGGALFYYDSGSFVERGQQILAQVGVLPEAERGPMRGDLGTPQTPFPEEGPRTLDGSRSMVYSILVGLAALAGGVEWLLLAQAAIVVTALWLPIRVALRVVAPGRSAAPATLAAVGLGSVGSLSFYVSYLMPDILAAVLILVAATLAAFAGRMRPWEIALALALGGLAVVSHLSHLAIAGLLLPLVALGALAAPGPRRWLAPLLMAGLVVTGFAERKAFSLAAQVTQDAEVVYRPFLTARLIQDGPGLRYLEDHCPDPAIPTCALAEALSWSDDPYRLTATHITFETSARLGSFQLMSAQDRRDVAAGQFRFVLAVTRDRPLDVALAVLRNTLIQARLTSVSMTLQSDSVVARLADLPGPALGPFGHGRLTAYRDWLRVADPVQALLYAASSLALLAALVSRRVPREAKVAVAMVILGILVNAFVCGALSQPAMRYGARVIWLLPATAVLAVALLRGAAPVAARHGNPRQGAAT